MKAHFLYFIFTFLVLMLRRFIYLILNVLFVMLCYVISFVLKNKTTAKSAIKQSLNGA